MNADIRLDHRLISVDHDETLHVMLELTPPAAQGPRRPHAVVLVLDRSGSMAGAKLAAAQACGAWLADRLPTGDLLGLVSFDQEVIVEAPIGPAGSGRVAHEIGRIVPRGSTNLSGGWLKALELLEGVTDVAARRILLLTDGLANVGITDSPTLVRLAGGAAERGVTTTTIGFGDGFDEDLLTAMADTGRGAAHHAAGPDDAAGVFAEEAADLAALAAQNVAVELRRIDPLVAGFAVLGDWPCTASGDAVRIELGDVFAGRTRRLVLQLAVAGLQELGPRHLADLTVHSTLVGHDVAQHHRTIPVVVHVGSREEAAAAGIDLTVREEVEILAAARARRDAIDAADRGDHLGARQALRAAAARLGELAKESPNHDALRTEAADLLASAEIVGAEDWDLTSRKLETYKEHRARRRRK